MADGRWLPQQTGDRCARPIELVFVVLPIWAASRGLRPSVPRRRSLGVKVRDMQVANLRQKTGESDRAEFWGAFEEGQQPRA